MPSSKINLTLQQNKKMETEKTIQNEKKVYQSPELKDLGKIGEVTNTGGNSGATDGGTGPTYTS